MITKENLREVLESLGFEDKANKNIYTKTYQNNEDIKIEVDFNKPKIMYSPTDSSFKEKEFPNKDKESKGIIIHRDTTLNFSANENFVCLVCMDYLLSKGYEPKHIIIEPTFPLGHANKPSYGDILVYDKEYNPLVLIENKTYGAEFSKEWNLMLKNGGQLFSYLGNMGKCQNLCLFACDFDSTNEQIFYKSHIITINDNEKYLEDMNKNLKNDEKKKGFREAKNTEEYYQVWNETYGLSFTTKGLFEKNIQSYKIGKDKYTLDDLESVPYSEIRTIYHDFATILRHHSIGNYENTFYILVDLFLCKIIDERNMQNNKSDELKFYWKGFAYDNPLDYCDRLLDLYEQGKRELFEIDVVNIKNEDLDKIFNRTKRYKGELKTELEKLFKEQKFYNIKKFNFIEVENEDEFRLNFKVLIQIAALIQDIYISKSDSNQFLGDLFEGFLNRSIHQTEGRFFTPTPITNFIINSLPEIKKDSKVLDYACGAGHFLTEFLQYNRECQIYGIEKNKNLSMVAKIASVFYDSKNEAKIIFQDALGEINKTKDYAKFFKNDSFDLIISNPPYAVKGFLEVLDTKERNNYILTKFIDDKSYHKNKAIECFFIERTKQLLKDEGYFVLVLPISILQKGGIYEKTREILLEHFKISCIVSMNSKTFGSTGTQTTIIFAQKVRKTGRDFINFLKETSFNLAKYRQEFAQNNPIEAYCEFLGYKLDCYIDFLSNLILSDELKNTESFKNYFSDYEKSQKYFKKKKITQVQQEEFFNSSEFAKTIQVNKKDLKKYRQFFNSFKESEEYKQKEEEWHYNNFLEQIKELEFEKILYFSYVFENEVLLIKSPEDKTKDNKSNKNEIIKFLGYDWSNRKGDEGIKYQTTIIDDELKERNDDSDEEKKEKEALRNINSVKFINTPLYNPKDRNDKTKLNYAIRAFMQNACSDELISSLQGENEDAHSLFKAKLIDMIDFEKVEFNKAISLNPCNSNRSEESNPFVNSKFELVRLKDFALDIQTAKRPSGGVGKYENGALSLGGEHIDNKNGYIKLDNPKYVPIEFYESFVLQDKGIVKQFDILICKDGALTGKIAMVRNEFIGQSAMINEHIFLLRCDNIEKQKYLFYILHSYSGQQALKSKITGSAQGGINKTNLESILIPNANFEIQKQIVAECEKIEEQYNTIRMNIEEYQNLIKAILAKTGVIDNEDSANSARANNSLSSLDTILQNLRQLESKLDFNLLLSLIEEQISHSGIFSSRHSELQSSEESSNNLRDVSPTAQHDNMLSHSEGSEATEESHNKDKQDFNTFANFSKTIQELLQTLPTPPQNGWERISLKNEKYIEFNPSKKEISELDENMLVSFIEMASISDKGYIESKIDKPLKEVRKGYTYFVENDILIAKITPCMENGKCAIAKNLTNHIGFGSTEFHIFRAKTGLDSSFLFYNLNQQNIREKAALAMTGASGHKRVPISFYENLTIPLPPLEIQEKITQSVEAVEGQISFIDSKLELLEAQKETILKKYLNGSNERERERTAKS